MILSLCYIMVVTLCFIRPQIIGATSCIIFVTVFGLGGTTPMILGKLGMAGASDEQEDQEDLEHLRASMALKFADASDKKGVAKLTAKTWGSVERIFVGTAGMAAYAEDHEDDQSRTGTGIDEDEEHDDNSSATPSSQRHEVRAHSHHCCAGIRPQIQTSSPFAGQDGSITKTWRQREGQVARA